MVTFCAICQGVDKANVFSFGAFYLCTNLLNLMSCWLLSYFEFNHIKVSVLDGK